MSSHEKPSPPQASLAKGFGLLYLGAELLGGMILSFALAWWVGSWWDISPVIRMVAGIFLTLVVNNVSLYHRLRSML